MLKNEYPPSFPLRLMHKDMRLALELARQKGVELPAACGLFCDLQCGKRRFERRCGLFSSSALLAKG